MAFWNKEKDHSHGGVAVAHGHHGQHGHKGKAAAPTPQEELARLVETCLGAKIPPSAGPVRIGGQWFGVTHNKVSDHSTLGLFLPCTKCEKLIHVLTVQEELERSKDKTWKAACLANNWPTEVNPKDGSMHHSALDLKQIILQKQSREEIAKYLQGNKCFSVEIMCDPCKQKL